MQNLFIISSYQLYSFNLWCDDTNRPRIKKILINKFFIIQVWVKMSKICFSCFSSSCPVCVYSPAGLLLHPQPGREEHAEGWGGRGDSYGEGAPWTGPDWHQERTHRYQGDESQFNRFTFPFNPKIKTKSVWTVFQITTCKPVALNERLF